MNKVDIQIKQMNISDFPEILSLWKKAGLNISDSKVEFADMKKILERNPESCLILTKDETIVGVVLGTFNGRRGWIYHLAIHPKFQNKGYGSLLLEKAEKELRNKGAHRINLGVSYTNTKVLSFYKKCGYSVLNDALWLGKDI